MARKNWYFSEVIRLRKFISKMQIVIFFVLSNVFAQFKYEFCDNPGRLTRSSSLYTAQEFLNRVRDWNFSVLARRYGKKCEALRAEHPDQLENEKQFFDSITRKGGHQFNNTFFVHRTAQTRCGREWTWKIDQLSKDWLIQYKSSVWAHINLLESFNFCHMWTRTFSSGRSRFSFNAK